MTHSWPQWLRVRPGTSLSRRGSRRFRLYLDPLENRLVLSGLVFSVTSSGDDPTGPTAHITTLRDAINEVNADLSDSISDPDVIQFAIAGKPTINLGADLPALHNPLTIEGGTPGQVSVRGKGFAMLVDDSTATLDDVTFSGGTVELGPGSILTVGAGSTLGVTGDLDSGSGATLNNDGTVSVSGNFVGADSLGVNNGPFTSGTTTVPASFTVSGAFTEGDDSDVYNNGEAVFKVAKDLTLGDYSYMYDGLEAADKATLTVGGSFSIGNKGFVLINGASTLKVTRSFTLGDGDFVNNGNEASDDTTLIVGGSFAIGTAGHVINEGTSTLKVDGGFTLGDGGFVDNGYSSTDAATLTVGKTLTLGVSGGAGTSIENEGASVFRVTGNLTLQGTSTGLYNGVFSTDTANFTVGGNVNLDANSFLNDEKTSSLSVAGGVTMGADSSFYDDGTVSVRGSFDPGPGGSNTSYSDDVIAGTFNTGPGGTVTTDAASWEVLAGGQLNVAGRFTVVAGGSLTVDSGGSLTLSSHGRLTVAGTVTDKGAINSVGGGIIAVSGSGFVAINQGGTLDVPNLVVAGSGQVDVFGTLVISSARVKGHGQIVTETGGRVLFSRVADCGTHL